jgi:hypothetical protein
MSKQQHRIHRGYRARLAQLAQLAMPVAILLLSASAGASQIGTVTQSRPSQSGERHLPVDTKFREWSRNSDHNDDVKRIKVCRAETVCKMTYKEGETPRTRVRNLVMPLRYEGETFSISEDFTRQVKQAFGNLQNKEGVKVRFIGYTDDAPLTGRDEATYGDHLSLSKAMANRVALTRRITPGYL